MAGWLSVYTMIIKLVRCRMFMLVKIIRGGDLIAMVIGCCAFFLLYIIDEIFICLFVCW